MLDCVHLEMRMAEIMSQQEASGFRFDVQAAERVRNELSAEMQDLEAAIILSASLMCQAKSLRLRDRTKLKGYVAGAPFTKLLDFNPTSRLNIVMGATAPSVVLALHGSPT